MNGPEILDKYVGESESKIRKLFEAAEEEEKRVCNICENRKFHERYRMLKMNEHDCTTV